MEYKAVEKHVASLEYCREFRGLGLFKDSFFVWVCCWGGLPSIMSRQRADRWLATLADDEKTEELISIFPAPISSELGEKLPDVWIHSILSNDVIIDGEPRRNWRFRINGEWQHFSDEANARARLLYYLIENGILK